MSLKVLFAVYDNGSYDNTFPMGFGAIGAILKKMAMNLPYGIKMYIIGQMII